MTPSTGCASLTTVSQDPNPCLLQLLTSRTECVRIFLTDWYDSDAGLNPEDASAYRLQTYGISPGSYRPGLADCAPLRNSGPSCPADWEPASGSEAGEPEPEGEPEGEPERESGPEPNSGRRLSEAQQPRRFQRGFQTRRLKKGGASKAGSGGGSNTATATMSGGGSTESSSSDQASPEPSWEDWEAQEEGIPDSCRRVAVKERERLRRRQCHGTLDEPSLLNTNTLGGYLYRGPNRFVGAMLVVQV